MREVERRLFEHLSPLIAPVVLHAVVAPQDVRYPCAVYQVSMATPENTLCGTGTLVDNTILLNLWAREYAEVLSLRQTVVEGMTELSLQNVLNLEMEDYDPDARVYRRILQYSVWEQE
jgi:hypothetical protein